MTDKVHYKTSKKIDLDYINNIARTASPEEASEVYFNQKDFLQKMYESKKGN